MTRIAQAPIQFTKQPYIEDVGPRKIESIQFSTFGESEILKATEVQVYHGVYYDSAKKPWENGLLDPHMWPNKLCPSKGKIAPAKMLPFLKCVCGTN